MVENGALQRQRNRGRKGKGADRRKERRGGAQLEQEWEKEDGHVVVRGKGSEEIVKSESCTELS